MSNLLITVSDENERLISSSFSEDIEEEKASIRFYAFFSFFSCFIIVFSMFLVYIFYR